MRGRTSCFELVTKVSPSGKSGCEPSVPLNKGPSGEDGTTWSLGCSIFSSNLSFFSDGFDKTAYLDSETLFFDGVAFENVC